MAKKSPMALRRAREAAVSGLFVQMQREIDTASSRIWRQYFEQFAALNPRGSPGTFSKAFDEAWSRSNLPNPQRADMTPNGNYHATGRDINGYAQPG